MKTKLYFGILVSFLSIISIVSCNDDDSNKWYNSMPDGGPFHTGNTIRLFYVDEEGNDLINLEDYSTLPVSSLVELDSQPVIESLYKNYGYNNDYNSVVFNDSRELHEFFTYVFGDSRQSNYTFYVYHNGSADQMDVTFQYQNHRNEYDYACSLVSWSVNGVEVYNIEKPTLRRNVYLVKKSDGTTSVLPEE